MSQLSVVRSATQNIKQNDWIVINEGATYVITTPGSVGRVLDHAGESLIVEFETDTISLQYFFGPSAVYDVHTLDVTRIKPPRARIAELEERERRAKLRVKAARRIREMYARLAHPESLRINRHDVYDSAAAREAVRAVGQAGGRFLANPNTDTARALIAAYRTASNTTTNVRYGRVWDRVTESRAFDRHICSCPDCGNYSVPEDMTEVAGDAPYKVCSVCLEHQYRMGTYEGKYIRSSRAVRVYESKDSALQTAADSWCSRAYAISQRWMYWNGGYMSRDLYKELCRDKTIKVSGTLGGYHGSESRGFFETNSTPNVPAIGVELEVYCLGERSAAVKAIRTEFIDWFCERDGSLDSEQGFEIVSQPYGPTEWAEITPKLMSLLKDKDVVGYTHPDTQRSYGIHLNVNRSTLSSLQEARLLMFMNYAGNLPFIMAIAQRAKLYGGDNAKQFGSISDRYMRLEYMGGTHPIRLNGVAKRKPGGLGKYSSINMHDKIAEFRIFQSTTNPTSFMKNLEFVWALLEWTSTAASTGVQFKYEQFVQWLAKPHMEAKYPHLMAYLRKPSFMGKKFEKRVDNTWNHLLLPTTTKSLEVVTGDEDARLAF